MAELVMALAITAITGLAVAGVSVALSSAYESSEGYSESIQTARTTTDRIRRAVWASKLVLRAGDGCLTVWRRDTNGDGQINLTEIVSYSLDRSNNRLVERYVAFPVGMSENTRKALDATVSLATALANDNYLGSANLGYGVTNVLAENVSSFAAEGDVAPPLTRLVEIELTVGQSLQTMTLRTAAGLRADYISRLQETKTGWVLSGGSAN